LTVQQFQRSFVIPRLDLFSQNRAMSLALAQLSIATAKRQAQLVLQLMKVAKFSLYVG
jgi:hypothetical protein